jgi:hypothetical protein
MNAPDLNPLVITAVVLFSSNASAELVDRKYDVVNALASCSTETASVLDNPDFKVLLDSKPINYAKVCLCTEEGVLQDVRLREYVKGERTVVANRLKSKEFKAYAAMRMLSSYITCLAQDIDESLALSDLPP